MCLEASSTGPSADREAPGVSVRKRGADDKPASDKILPSVYATSSTSAREVHREKGGDERFGNRIFLWRGCFLERFVGQLDIHRESFMMPYTNMQRDFSSCSFMLIHSGVMLLSMVSCVHAYFRTAIMSSALAVHRTKLSQGNPGSYQPWAVCGTEAV